MRRTKNKCSIYEKTRVLLAPSLSLSPPILPSHDMVHFALLKQSMTSSGIPFWLAAIACVRESTDAGACPPAFELGPGSGYRSDLDGRP